ncbi:MAG: ATP-binding protein [Lachnospiraceae bacterium]|nr:ATP-binding protein [Lachnospiraceae bacterium]
MNISIRKQLAMIFIGLMAAILVVSMLANSLFLEDFYYVRKKDVLQEAYRQLNEGVDDSGIMSEESMAEFNDLCIANSITFVVEDQNFRKQIWTDMEMEYLRIIAGRLYGYMMGLDGGTGSEIMEQNDKYTIWKKYDSAVGLDYMEIWGTLDNGFYFLVRITMDSIRDSVNISNEFIKYVCLVGIILSVFIIWWVTRKVAEPIRELTELSKRMADLDFGVRYTSGGKNEIGQLGEHFNQMSEKLEKAYSQLMTANNELQKDIEEKTRIDEMRREFLSNVSHELKTPIALIQGYAEGLKECVNDDEESREFYCDVIMDESSKMNHLVRQLLTLNHLEEGREEVVMERFDMVPLIHNKIQSVSLLAQQKEARITYYGPEELVVWGDEFKVEEVLTNYLSNAVNHVDGECRIEVKAQETDTKVRISVHNTGQPIPDKDIDQIWGKFYKVDKARTREYGGSGIGLSIVKAIMESFHQSFGVKNCEDGVEFWFELESGKSVPKNAQMKGNMHE